jgi:hypothetical protein
LTYAGINKGHFEGGLYKFCNGERELVLDLSTEYLKFGGNSYEHEGYIIVDFYGDEWVALAHLLCCQSSNIEVYTDIADGECIDYVFACNSRGDHKEVWFYHNEDLETDYESDQDVHESEQVKAVARLLPEALFKKRVLSWCHS